MLGVGGVFDNGGNSPVDSVVVDALQRGEWSPDDPLSCLYHSLQAFVVHDSGTAVPHSDATGRDALNNAAVEIPEDLNRHAKLPEQKKYSRNNANNANNAYNAYNAYNAP